MAARMPQYRIELTDGPIVSTLTVAWQARRGTRWHVLHVVTAQTPLRCLAELGQWAQSEIDSARAAQAQVDAGIQTALAEVGLEVTP